MAELLARHRRSGRMPDKRVPSPAPSSSASSSSRPSTPSDGPDPVDQLSMKLDGAHLVEKAPPTPRAIPAGKPPLFVQEARRQLVQGKWKTLVTCPKGVDQLEWIGVNLYDFNRNIGLVYEVINSSGCCTTVSCPSMSIAPNGDCAWAGARGSRAAPLFFDAVTTWIQKLIDDPAVFPTQAGRQFNDAFLPIAKRIWACLADLWSHLYYAHYSVFVDLSLEAYTNSLISHFAIFGLANELVAKSAQQFDPAHAKGHVIGNLMKEWSRPHVVPKDLRL